MIGQTIKFANIKLYFEFINKKGKSLNYSIFINLKDPYIEEITIAREKLSHEVDGYRLVSVSRELL